MELMPCKARACTVSGNPCPKSGQTIAQMHLPLLETGDQPQKPRHPVSDAVLVDQSLAHRHIAPAFAVHGLRIGKGAQTRAEPVRVGKHTAVQLRIPPRQPADISGRIGCLVGQGRERQDFRPRPMPALQKMWIDETERPIPR